jgi:hypothetical protein
LRGLSAAVRRRAARFRTAVDRTRLRRRTHAPKIISADSHITEPGNTYVDHIDAKFRERAPHLEHADSGGDLFVIPGMKPSKRAIEPASASDIVALDEAASRQPTNRPELGQAL